MGTERIAHGDLYGHLSGQLKRRATADKDVREFLEFALRVVAQFGGLAGKVGAFRVGLRGD